MEVESAKEDVVDILNEIAENNNILSKTEVMKNNLSEKLSDLVKTQNNLISDIELKNQEINKIQNNIESLNSELITFKDDKNSTEEKLKSLENNIKIQNRKYEETLNEYNSALAKLRLLRDMDKEYEGYNHSIKNLMKYIEKNEPLRKNVLGVVGELIDVKSEYSLAIEIALGSAIQDIITETTESAKDLISVLKKNNFGRATFLPLDNITYKPFDKSLNRGDGVIGLASDIIDYDKKN